MNSTRTQSFAERVSLHCNICILHAVSTNFACICHDMASRSQWFKRMNVVGPICKNYFQTISGLRWNFDDSQGMSYSVEKKATYKIFSWFFVYLINFYVFYCRGHFNLCLDPTLTLMRDNCTFFADIFRVRRMIRRRKTIFTKISYFCIWI